MTEVDKEDFKEHGPQERDLRVVRLSQGRLRPDPGHQERTLRLTTVPPDRPRAGRGRRGSQSVPAASRHAAGRRSRSGEHPMAAEVHTQISGEELAHTFEEQGPEIEPPGLRRRGLGDARHLLGDGARGLPAVLHALRAERFASPGPRRSPPTAWSWSYFLGRHVRAPRAAHPRRLPVPLPAGRRRRVRWRRAIDALRTVFFAYGAYLVWRFMEHHRGRDHDDDQLAEEPDLRRASSSASC